MSFNTFCNICFIKQNIIELYVEENEPILNILNSFTSCPDIVNGIIYLCINCCNKLEEFDKLRELYLTNFVRFRYLYYEHKKQLEIRNAPDIEKQLKKFVDINVERASGTPLIENYENIWFSQKNNTLESKTQTWHVIHENHSYNRDHEHIHGNCIVENSEASVFDEPYNEFINTDFVSISLPCSSVVYKKNSNLSATQKLFQIEDINLEEDEPNSDRFKESTNDQLVSDFVNNVIPCCKSTDNDSTNPENCATLDTLNGEESTDAVNKTTKNDTVCNVCHKRFTCSSNLEVHMHTHTGEKPYNCDKCNKTFARNFHLVEHKRIHTGNKPYKCEECGLGFTKSGDLNRHKRRHTGERPYPCDECQKTFSKRSSLVEHKLIHSGEKPYKCDECGSGFRQSSKLKTHKRTHTGERPYSCDECQKTFTKRCNLIEHKIIHSGEKPYKCNECGLRFTQRSNLNKHKRIHTGERPYSCDECHKKFTDTSNLARHKRTHISKKP